MPPRWLAVALEKRRAPQGLAGRTAKVRLAPQNPAGVQAMHLPADGDAGVGGTTGLPPSPATKSATAARVLCTDASGEAAELYTNIQESEDAAEAPTCDRAAPNVASVSTAREAGVGTSGLEAVTDSAMSVTMAASVRLSGCSFAAPCKGRRY